jgi:hypothetical protein
MTNKINQKFKGIKIFLFILILSSFFVSISFSRAAGEKAGGEPVYYDQSYDLCYTGCAAWKLYWGRNAFWQYVQDYCTMDAQDAAKTLVKFAFNTVRTSPDFGVFIQSLYCAGFIKLYIVPKLDECRQACEANIWTYAPDLIVTRGQGTSQPGVFYFADKNKLQIEIYNGGYVYSPAFRVDIYEDETRNYDCQVDSWEKIAFYEVPELAPFDVKRNDLNIPSRHTKEIDWTAPADKCAKIKVVVDPDNRIPELDEAGGAARNNEYILTVNNLPIPPRYRISEVESELVGTSLDEVKLSFKLKNDGEEVGRPRVEARDCWGEKILRAAKDRVQVEPGETVRVELDLKNLFWPDKPSYFRNRCITITAKDENGSTQAGTYISIYSASISGRVLDMRGQPVAGTTVSLENGTSTQTDAKGYYRLSGLTNWGKFKLTASHPDYDYTAEHEVELTYNPDPAAVSQEGLHKSNVDLVLFQQPASLKINCPTTEYGFRLNGQYFSYQGLGEEAEEILGAIVPGEYQLVLHRPGYSVRTLDLELAAGEEKQIDCGLKPLRAYNNDQGIKFKPVLNNLWDYDLPAGYNIEAAEISADGSTVFLALNSMRANNFKLLIFNQAGQKLGELVLPDKPAYSSIYLSPSYDGAYVLVDNYLLVSRQGQIISRNEDDGLGARGALSWDGSLICNHKGLYSSSFVPLYTGVWGRELDKPHTRCRFGQFAIFTAGQNTISQCEKVSQGLCRLSFWDGTQSPLLSLGNKTNYWHTAVTPNGRVVLATVSGPAGKEAVYLRSGQVVWRRPIDSANGRVSISPGGGYAVVLDPRGKDFSLRVFDRDGNDLLARAGENKSWQWGQDFYAAQATGQGVFYLRYDGQVHFGVLGSVGQAEKINLANLSQTQGSSQDLSSAQANQQSEVNSTTSNQTGSQVNNKNKAEVSQQTQSLLGRLLAAVKNFLRRIFSWLF